MNSRIHFYECKLLVLPWNIGSYFPLNKNFLFVYENLSISQMKKAGYLIFPLFLCSCQDEEVTSLNNVSNDPSDVVVELNADALYNENHTIKPSEAEQFAITSAKALFNDKNNGLKSARTLKVSGISVLKSPKSSLKSGSVELPDTLAYFVNFEDNNGWAYISADDRVKEPLLAIFESGNYDPETISEIPGLKALLDNAESYMIDEISTFEKYKEIALKGCGNSLKKKKKDKIVTYNGTYDELEDISNFRLISTTWGQSGKYSKYCPKCSSCGNSKQAGCVITAYAQILAYWENPTKINNYDMNWSAMKANRSIDNVSTTAQEQIAHLMAELGTMNKTDYHCSSCEGRGSTTYDFVESFSIDYLVYKCGYGFNYKVLNKNSIGSEIVNYLKAYPYPAIVSSGGHQWIIDEFKTYTPYAYTIVITGPRTTYFHHNWGWGGQGNGYFSQNVFQPNRAESYDYTASSNSKNYLTGNTTFVLYSYWR